MTILEIHSHGRLVNISQHFTSDVLPTGLFVVEDAGRRGEDDDPNTTGGKQVINPLLNTVVLYVEPRRDDSCFV